MTQSIKSFWRIQQKLLDKTVLYKQPRWIFLFISSTYVLYRIVIYDYEAILFFWGLYVLYLIVQFYTPSGLPDPDQDIFSAPPPPSVQESEQAPINVFQAYSQSEDRPLLRTITEFSLWKNIMITILSCWVATLSQIFRIPVYWPFLLIYFVWLLGLAARKHLKHMKKYGYSLKDFGKKKHKNSVYI